MVIGVSSNPTGLKLEGSLTLRETAAKMKGIRWEVFLLHCGPLLTHRVNVIQQRAQSEFCRTGMCTWRQATAANMSVPGRWIWTLRVSHRYRKTRTHTSSYTWLFLSVFLWVCLCLCVCRFVCVPLFSVFLHLKSVKYLPKAHLTCLFWSWCILLPKMVDESGLTQNTVVFLVLTVVCHGTLFPLKELNYSGSS